MRSISIKKWGIGSKSTNRGVLILYAIRDRRARIEVGYGLEPILPDGKVGGFQREAIPLMRSGNYNDALMLVTSRVADVIATDAGVQLTSSRPRAPTQGAHEPGGGLSLGGIIVIIVVVLIILARPYAASFSGCCFLRFSVDGAEGSGVVAGALEGAAGSADLVEAVLVAVGPAAVGNKRGCNGFLKIRSASL